MALTRKIKEARLSQLKEDLAEAQSVILVDFQGTSVAQATAIRTKCRESNVTYQVVKNTLARLAIKDTDMEPLSEQFVGVTAVLYSKEDPVTPAKAIEELAAQIDKLKIKGGFLSGTLLNEEGVKRLAKMPGKNELRAQLLGLLTAPARNMVSVLAAVPRSMVTVLQAKADKAA